jgi:hypothetical protein
LSLIPADEVTYLDCVAEFFLAQRGTGLVISSPDVELVRAYEGAGVPSSVVCKGIERAFERRRHQGKPPLRRLTSCRRTIDAEVRRFLGGGGRLPGELPDPPMLDRLVGLSKEAQLPEEKAAYRAAYRAACGGGASDEAAGIAYLEALPKSECTRLSQAVRARIGPRFPEVSLARYRDRLRSELIREALRRLPFPLKLS